MTCQFRVATFQTSRLSTGKFLFLFFATERRFQSRAAQSDGRISEKVFRELLFMNFVFYSCSLVFEDVSCRNMALSRMHRRIDLGGSEDFMNGCNAFSFIYLC